MNISYFDRYFGSFLDADMEKNYYYSVKQYSRSKNGYNGHYYYEIGMKNIEEIIYDDEGELKDDTEEYDILIERFYDYLVNEKNIKNDVNKDLVENIASDIYEYVSIYCY